MRCLRILYWLHGAVARVFDCEAIQFVMRGLESHCLKVTALASHSRFIVSEDSAVNDYQASCLGKVSKV